MVLNRLKAWYTQYERHLSSLALLSGFVFDAVTLKRVDLFLENIWVVIHLLMAALGIIFLNVYENHKKKFSKPTQGLIYFWLIILVQFSFGGLLSTFLVFYFRSATLTASWPFLVLLVIFLIGNELFKKHYTRLVFQVSVLFISIYSFAIYILPVMLHQISDGVFLLSGLASISILAVFIWALWFIARERFKQSRWLLALSITLILGGINLLYFANLIPPLPLSLKDGGVYHQVERTSSGTYTALGEAKDWFDYFRVYPLIHKEATEPVYVYTAIFSPPGLNTPIIHRWQRYDTSARGWVTVNQIPLSLVGGREGGYRTYSLEYGVSAGRWRVDALTPNGLLIGRVRFQVVTVTPERKPTELLYNL